MSSYYGGTLTVLGRNLITTLIAGETITFTKIMVGSGKLEDGVEPIDVTDLISPVAEATSTVPTVENGVVSMTIEYRNDMNGGLTEAFWLNEIGIYAKTESSDEILLYYATLGDSPQPVNAYTDSRVDIRRFPISIALTLDSEDVEISYTPEAFITSDDAEALVSSLVTSALSTASQTTMTDITIPAADWQESGDETYPYYCDVAVEDMTDSIYPVVSIYRTSLAVASDADLSPAVQSLTGALRFWAYTVPTDDINVSVALLKAGVTPTASEGTVTTYELPTATETRLGGVMIGDGINVDEYGTISSEIQIATDEEAAEMLGDVEI